MLHRIASWIFLLTGIVIALGAFGHDANAAKLADEFAKFPAFDAKTRLVVMAVWHLCSGCMLVFGAICTWVWWRARKDGHAPFVVTDLIAAFYAVVGVATVWYTRLPFFWLFAGLGGTLFIASLPLRRPRIAG
jgi:hypothetical protein